MIQNYLTKLYLKFYLNILKLFYFHTTSFEISNKFFQNFPMNFSQSHQNWFKIIQHLFISCYLIFFFNFFNKLFQNIPKNSLQSHQNRFKIIKHFFKYFLQFKTFFWNFQQIFQKELLFMSSKLIQNYFSKLNLKFGWNILKLFY